MMLAISSCQGHHLASDVRTSHTRHRVDDVIIPPPLHGGLHHSLHHHIRHMVSRRGAPQNRRQSDPLHKPEPKPRRAALSFDGLDGETVSPPAEMEAPASSDSDSDAGITFTAPAVPDLRTEEPAAPSPLQPTAAESSLPWKRAYIQPALPSRSDPAPELPAPEPSWACAHVTANVTGHVAHVEDDRTDDTGLFSIPPPWRTSPSSEDRTENDSALPRSHDLTDSPQDPISKPTIPQSLTLHDSGREHSALPWRSPSASNEVEPMISPSASQIWSHAPLGPIVENGQSHHSDPHSGHHHVTANVYQDSDIQDYRSLLPQNNSTFQPVPEPELAEGDEDEILTKLQCHRRNPSFVRTKGHMLLERRPSITLPVDREEDCRARIHKWLQSSHPDSLACPPDFVMDMGHPTLDETV